MKKLKHYSMFLTVLPRKIKKIINQNLLDKNNLLNNFECYFLNCSSSNLLNFNQKTERIFLKIIPNNLDHISKTSQTATLQIRNFQTLLYKDRFL